MKPSGMQTGITNRDGCRMPHGRWPTRLWVLLGVAALALTMRWVAPITDARHPEIPEILQNRPELIKVQAAIPLTADQALREARAALAEGHLDEALRYCQEGVRLDPRSALAYFLLGMIQIRRGDEDAARQALLQ